MSEDEVFKRVTITFLFSVIAAAGIWMTFGFWTKMNWLLIVFAVALLSGTYAKFFRLTALVSFVLGVLSWSGLLPGRTELTSVYAKGSLATAQASSASVLSEKLSELHQACQAGLMSETECKSSREAVISRFSTER